MEKMKKYKGAVFFDVDGTLIDERLGVSVPTESTKKAISLLKENGYLTCVATGRAKCYLCDLQTDFDCYITCNGAVGEIDGQVLFADRMDMAKQIELCRYLSEKSFWFLLETRERCYYSENNQEDFMRFMREGKLSTEHFYVLEDVGAISACKAMIGFKSAEEYKELCERFKDDFLITQHHTDPEADISIAGVTKASGILRLVDLLGIDIKNTYAFGDGANDVQMLSSVGCGIAMTPHASELDGIAKMTAGGVADGGIYNALRELKLI